MQREARNPRKAEIMDIATALFDQDEVTRRTTLEIWNEGKDEGEKTGEKNASLRIAKSLKESNTPPEIIAKCTGLTLEQIEKL